MKPVTQNLKKQASNELAETPVAQTTPEIPDDFQLGAACDPSKMEECESCQ